DGRTHAVRQLPELLVERGLRLRVALRARDRVVRSGDGHAGDALRAAGVRYTENDVLLDAIDGPEPCFQVVGVYVFAVRGDDRILRTPDDGQLPLAIQLAEIARVEPPVLVDRAARLF